MKDLQNAHLLRLAEISMSIILSHFQCKSDSTKTAIYDAVKVIFELYLHLHASVYTQNALSNDGLLIDYICFGAE